MIQPAPPRLSGFLPLLLFGVVALWNFFNFDPASPYRHFMPEDFTAPALAMAGRFGPAKTGVEETLPIPKCLRLPGYGRVNELLTGDQRVGYPMLCAPFVRLFQEGGFRVFTALTRALLFLGVWWVVWRQTKRRWAACLAGMAVSFNALMSLTFPSFNFTVALCQVLFLMFFMGVGKTPRAHFIFGLFTGASCVVFPEFFVFTPVLVLLLFGLSWRWFDVKPFLKGGALTLFPLVFWNSWAYHAVLVHTTQHGGVKALETLPDFYLHHLGPWAFKFNGMLQWPLYGDIVRTPQYPFPVFLLIPLQLLQVFGIVGIAVAAAGLVLWLFPSHRFDVKPRRFWALQGGVLLALGLWWLLTGLQENWEDQKALFLFWYAVPISFFLGIGSAKIGTKRREKKLLLTVTFFLVVILGVFLVSRTLNFPPDPRWPLRFPMLATPNETPEALERRRAFVTTLRWLPMNPWAVPFAYSSKMNLPHAFKGKQGILQEFTTVDGIPNRYVKQTKE